MTGTSAATGRPGGAGGAASSGAVGARLGSRFGRGGGARGGFGTALVIGVLALLLLLALLLHRASPSAVTTDPESTAPNGSRALVALLTGRGDREVDVVRSRAELEDAGIDEETTLLISRADRLPSDSLEDLDRIVFRSARVVLVRPSDRTLAALGIDLQAADRASGIHRDDGCDAADVDDGDTISGDVTRYLPAQDPRGEAEALGCFLDAGDRATGGSADEAAPFVQTTTIDGSPVTVIGGTSLLINGGLAQQDNAAVALRVLGHTPRTVWYLPDPLDLAGGADGSQQPDSSGALAPAWFVPALWILGGSALMLVLWRGRRFGRLVVEPLPSVVRASETTYARSRLYRRAGDPGRAANLLIEAAAARLAAALSLAPNTPRAEVAARVAELTGRDPADTLALLTPRDPATTKDTQLSALANELREVEKEVRRS